MKAIAGLVAVHEQARRAGFFFGMRRTIGRAAFNASAAQLFDPANRIIGQEGDLFSRMGAVVRCCRRSIVRKQRQGKGIHAKPLLQAVMPTCRCPKTVQ